ncbi:MAG: hypothetical protein Kow0037_25930 [Calditrichia bacterium]
MANCDRFREQFSNYLEGELRGTELQELEAHFQACEDCAVTYRQMKIIQNSLRQLPKIKTSAEFERELHRQIFQQNGQSRRIPFSFSRETWKMPAMGSALVAAAVGFFLIFNSGPDTPANATTPGFQQAAPGISSPLSAKKQSATTQRASSKTLITDSTDLDIQNPADEGVQLVGDRK